MHACMNAAFIEIKSNLRTASSNCWYIFKAKKAKLCSGSDDIIFIQGVGMSRASLDNITYLLREASLTSCAVCKHCSKEGGGRGLAFLIFFCKLVKVF